MHTCVHHVASSDRSSANLGVSYGLVQRVDVYLAVCGVTMFFHQVDGVENTTVLESKLE